MVMTTTSMTMMRHRQTLFLSRCPSSLHIRHVARIPIQPGLSAAQRVLFTHEYKTLAVKPQMLHAWAGPFCRHRVTARKAPTAMGAPFRLVTTLPQLGQDAASASLAHETIRHLAIASERCEHGETQSIKTSSFAGSIHTMLGRAH
ncbi:hypothetical protein IWW38_003143 [Coemansia aciculifera]|uniref:Uncharacterized protein n=1 Tax=Coemansia aciculifera TaxID=417176 RepID=A0ACC1M1Y7_9FUNG|nr:hypothetical protein IWW38_003143 [Coemansia aciculifera]